MSIPANPPECTEVLVLFDLRRPEQASAFNTIGAAFPKPPVIEPVLGKVWAVYIQPGLCKSQEAA